MKKKRFYLCSTNNLLNNSYYTKWIDEIKDEVIVFIDNFKCIKVFSSICPHFGGEIFYNDKKNELKCKWHGWKFCIKSGQCLSHPIKGRLKVYDFDIAPNKLKNYSHIIKNNKIYLVKNS